MKTQIETKLARLARLNVVVNTWKNWIHWVVVGLVWRFHWLILTAGLQILPNLLPAPLCETFHLSDSLSTRSTAVPSLLSLLQEECVHMCVCVSVCASHRRGLSSRFLQNLGLALWFGAGQLIQGRTESEKECEEEEWATDGERAGRMPDSIESLCTVFEVRGWGFRGKQDYSESIPLNNPGVWATAKTQRSLTTAVCPSAPVSDMLVSVALLLCLHE